LHAIKPDEAAVDKIQECQHKNRLLLHKSTNIGSQK
jgi:hypothetical protein